jgi:hypothetical protein
VNDKITNLASHKANLNGQWIRNDLMMQYWEESKCYRLIDGCTVKVFNEIIKRRVVHRQLNAYD